MFRANNFDKLLDKATSNLRLDPDWPTILQICDLIRQNDCSLIDFAKQSGRALTSSSKKYWKKYKRVILGPLHKSEFLQIYRGNEYGSIDFCYNSTRPKYAVAAVKKKLYSQNPHQAMFALLTLESIVKNCGSGIHDEVTSKAFCEMLRDLVKTTQHENLRNKILELIQAWAFAFRNAPKYRAVQDTVNILKAEGFKFPTLKESDAMFSADTAPEWADGEVCHRCRVAFSLMVRRHHCRACGQVFCQQCSSKTSTLPKFGIEKEVRVCDACYDKVSRPPPSGVPIGKLEINDTANDYGPTQPQKRTGGKTAEELQEEEELQLALALSQSEAEQKEKERKSRQHIAPDPTPHPTVSPTPSSVSASPEHSTQANSELSRYLDRNYWEQRLSRENPSVAPTAPAPTSNASDITEVSEDFTKPSTTKAQDDDAEDKEIDEFVETLKSQVEIFVNRMKSNSSRGRSIANDTAVQTLFMNITTMHSRLLRYIQMQDDKRVYLESLQDKVTQIRDSRAALDTLRAEHAARLAAAAEAAERQRQMQMAVKLQAMRKKKHEYLQYQRQLALQRVQEQEREMQMRQEQQKHQYMMSANNFYMPSVSMPQFPTGFNQQPIYGNPQYHPQMMAQTTADNVPVPGQPQMTTTNMSMNMPLGTIQSVPQVSNTFAMTTATQPNLRPNMPQQLPLQQQMLMQQMHQLRMQQPGIQQPGIQQPGMQQPGMQQPGIQQPGMQQPGMQQPGMQQPGMQQPGMQQPGMQQPGMQQPGMQQPGIQQQPGMHQLGPQNIPNGQNIPQQNGQTNLPKQTVPNQQQPPNSMMPNMPVGQQNMPQAMMNQLLSKQMQNMRMNPMQGNLQNANSQVPISVYQNIPNQPNTQPTGPQPQSAQQPQQTSLPGQPMSLQGQQLLQGQSLPGQPQPMQMNNNIQSTNQNPAGPPSQAQGQQLPPSSHQQQMPIPGQGQPPGQQMMMQGQQIPSQIQNIPQPMINQGQPSQGQLPPGHPGQHTNQGQLPPNLPGQQLPQAQMPPTQLQQANPNQQMQMPQQMQMGQMAQQTAMVQNHPIQGIPQQMPGAPQMAGPQQMQQGQPGPQNFSGQQVKMQQQNFNNTQQPQQQPVSNQQAQTPIKSENNNNTAELISFD